MNLNRGLGIKLIDSVESCEKYIRAYYQGNVNKCIFADTHIGNLNKSSFDKIWNNKKIFKIY